MSADLNLSRRPFQNPRPVRRVTMLLWAAGLIVAALNVRLYWSHYSGSSENREQQQTLAASIDSEQAQVGQLSTELASFDVDWQNDQSAFLNSKIAERSFSWSQLFDHLGEVLPAEARVSSLSPEFSGGRRRGSSGPSENEVELDIRGSAKNSEVLFEFIDSLFGHPSFRGPNLTNESLQDDGLLDFTLSVIYEARPPEPEEPPEALADGAQADGAADGAAGGPAEAAAVEEAGAETGEGEDEDAAGEDVADPAPAETTP